ncbi:MAG: SPFH domain-containing protein [bacterium]
MLIIIFFAVLAVFFMIFLAASTYIVKQAEVILIERFGEYHRMLTSGLHFIMPFIDKPRLVAWTFTKEDARGKSMYRYIQYIERIDLRESVYDFPRQSVITKDNVTMEINAVFFYQITDPKAAVYEVVNLPLAIEKLTQTTLRDVIGSLDLDETLTSRAHINKVLTETLDSNTDKWGIKVNRVELQELNPPQDILIAMEKQMKAERDRRALILESEGLKGAAILNAEGEKESQITKAQGQAEARRLIAQSEADAITIVQKSVPGADPLPYMIALNYIKALPEMTKDKEGKMIILPYESSALMGSLATIKEIFNK